MELHRLTCSAISKASRSTTWSLSRLASATFLNASLIAPSPSRGAGKASGKPRSRLGVIFEVATAETSADAATTITARFFSLPNAKGASAAAEVPPYALTTCSAKPLTSLARTALADKALFLDVEPPPA